MNLQTFIQMVQSMLDDDNGISERAYMSLCALHDTITDKAIQLELGRMMNRVESVDGRFYLPIDFAPMDHPIE